MEATLPPKPVITPAQSDEAVRQAARLLSVALPYGEDRYERPEYVTAEALIMESAKFEAALNGRSVAVEYQIALGMAYDAAQDF